MNSQDVIRYTPYLRRYARALTGAQREGDAFVKATLEAYAVGRADFDPALPAKTALFKAFHGVWRRSFNGHSIDAPGRSLEHWLSVLTPEHRTALLLAAMEGFSMAETAAILRVPLQTARERYEAAEANLEGQEPTHVLIVEDEPVVALDLHRLASSLGHRVTGVAATRSQAQDLAQKSQPGLVLADVRLADGSSGVDAVADMLKDFDVPVIFITACPEELLTGRGSEPAFLIAKPFQDATVKAVIGQALFFQDAAPLY